MLAVHFHLPALHFGMGVGSGRGTCPPIKKLVEGPPPKLWEFEITSWLRIWDFDGALDLTLVKLVMFYCSQGHFANDDNAVLIIMLSP